jgi:hypothetical protein
MIPPDPVDLISLDTSSGAWSVERAHGCHLQDFSERTLPYCTSGTSQRALLGWEFQTPTQHGSWSRSSGEGRSGQQPLTASCEGRQGLFLQAIEAFL